MSKQLCLKWKNYSVSILQGIKNIEFREKYCDATIVCQGMHFPVHRIVLSTCSKYFEEIFDQIKCPNPYIVINDIELREIDLLLSYMYEGEVNVLQASLHTFIKAARTLKIKGLAVPDDFLSNKEEKSQKRPNLSSDVSIPKRRKDKFSRQRDYSNTNWESSSNSDINENQEFENAYSEDSTIKEEHQEYFPEEVSTELDGSALEDPTIEDFSQVTSDPTDNEDLPVEDQVTNQEISKGESQFGFGGINDSIALSNQTRDTSRNSMSVKTSSQISNCSYCTFSSKFPHNVRRHVLNKHAGKKPFSCYHCKMRFSKKITLIRHMTLHTGQRPLKTSRQIFNCSYCTYSSKISSNVRRHITQNHTGKNPSAVLIANRSLRRKFL